MKILTVNAGSSSLKFTLFEMPEEKAIASGLFEKIGLNGSSYTIKYNGEKITKEYDLKDHSVAVKKLMDELIALGIINSLDEIEGVGHRILHGAQEFSEPTVLNMDVVQAISKYNELGPLHNPANLMGATSFIEALPNVTNVGVFDTAFHQTMGEEEFLYPVPFEWYQDYGIRKYGFHGTSHKYIWKFMSEVLGSSAKIISCHIGNGGSLCAIRGGKVVDTTMGFTPLAGIMMGSRSGDIDPSIIPFIMKKLNKSADEIITMLNKNSGLLGVSGVSSDSRDVEAGANEGNERCALAERMYAQKIANFIAMYNNLLDGADAIVFTAGVGENSITMRKMIIERIHSLGVATNDELNNVRGEFKKISTDESRIALYVVPTNEELMIATDTYNIIVGGNH
ncbi:MAG TPA: acetate kinase [Candidatus Caccenecus avistercoris]|nr:acetate kinase [Candidatus Caccenecus avistercoris]